MLDFMIAVVGNCSRLFGSIGIFDIDRLVEGDGDCEFIVTQFVANRLHE